MLLHPNCYRQLDITLEVFSFSRYRDIEGPQNFKSRLSDPDHVTSHFLQNFTICLKFNMFDILINFCDNSFNGSQEIR